MPRPADVADDGRAGPSGALCDDHDLSLWARAYGESVVRGTEWPLSAVDLSKLSWATSGRIRRKNGYCAYEPGGRCTVTFGEHVYERAGFAACRETVRHELVHAWQHQHAGEVAVVDGTDATDAVDVDPGHGPSFRAWVEPLDLEGRCATHYERTPADYAYVFECPTCGDWWGRHRLCRSVRQAAHGRAGSAGYCYCVDCESLVYLRAGDRYLDHADHDDDAIRAFAAGDGNVPTTAVEQAALTARPAADD